MHMLGKIGKRNTTYLKLGALGTFIGILACSNLQAGMTGNCGNCHTMHNSQGGKPMTYDGSTTPKDNLLRGDCLGCHAQGKGAAIENDVPQVYHAGGVDLAGGNFAYIDGFKGGSAADNKGHNIGPLTGEDKTLYAPPGGISQTGHSSGGNVNTTNLTCAGTNGCHGYRYREAPKLVEGITGAHHNNASGQLANPTEPGNSYRFLMGVKGFEDPRWEESPSSATHNEYFGLTAPIALGCGGALTSCHDRSSTKVGVRPPDGTMSQYCATCHGNFHTVTTSDDDGIGGGTSPFIRHPTDLALPMSGEYTSYDTYDLGSPVARTSVPANSDPGVTAGSDVVMCLSCHVAHGSPYASMLRWDYSTMVADNGGTTTNGCFTCHTTKD